MVRHDQVRVGADAQAREVDALGAQVVELAGQHLRVDHDAVADRAQLARVEDPGRDQVELPLHAVADDRVAGVVAALEADHEVRVLGEQVGDLALALVAPLGAHDHDAGHVVESVYGRGAPYRARACAPPTVASLVQRRRRPRTSGQLEATCGGRRRHRQRRRRTSRTSRETVRSPICSRSSASVEVGREHDRAAAVLVARVDDRVELLEHPRRALLGADVVDVQQVDRAQAVEQLAERELRRRRRTCRAAAPAAAAASRSRPCGRASMRGLGDQHRQRRLARADVADEPDAAALVEPLVRSRARSVRTSRTTCGWRVRSTRPARGRTRPAVAPREPPGDAPRALARPIRARPAACTAARGGVSSS